MNPSLQYYQPQKAGLFVGDCMPFSHEGRFFFYYLLDEGHHSGLGGLGGHQWALATSADLRSWEHHPLALPVDAEWEGSICTGSVFYHNGQYYAFYATRKRDYTQHLSLAVSPDGIHYRKTQPNPFFSPPAGYNPYHFRDPFAFQGEDGLFHLLVTACLDPHPLGRGGCLAHLVSADLQAWEMREPFLVPGTPDVPECSDLFAWNGWYYLLFSSGLTAHYRMSHSQSGPWQHPGQDILEAPAARVMKTAAWEGRRIGVAWLGEREGDRDGGRLLWGGQAVFRELVQAPDGRLSVCFVPELALPCGEPQVERVDGGLKLARVAGLEALSFAQIPTNARIRLLLRLGAGNGPFGLRLRAGEGFDSGYELLIEPALGRVRLFDQELVGLNLTGETLEVEIIMKGSILDVCLNRQHCLITRAIEQRGERLWIFAQDRACQVDSLDVRALLE